MLHELDIEYEVDYLLLGLSCFEKDYRLCWLLNRQFGLSLERDDDLRVQRKGVEQCFPLFTYFWEEEDVDLTLLKNRTDEGVLLPEVKQMDYLLRLDADDFPEGFTVELRAMTRIAGVFEIDATGLKSKDLLMF